jgi:uncharacterized protein YceK
MTTRVRYSALVLVIVVASVVSGCATDVVMRNPRTGETATCRASLAGFNPWSQQEACIGDHIAGGWVRTE